MATYLMADIHGHRDLFHKMLEEIAFSKQDTLYILGDVTDRGPEGIELLMEIMGTSNIVFLMGNNEDLLLRYIQLYGYGVDLRAWELLGGCPTLAGYAALAEAQQQKLEAFLENAPSHAVITKPFIWSTIFRPIPDRRNFGAAPSGIRPTHNHTIG